MARPGEGGGTFGGVMPGLVTNNRDPEGLGRVKLHLPWIHDEDDETYWARICQPMAGKGMGWWILPEIDDEVLVAFEHGDVRFPYVLGGLYNGKDRPPSTGMPGGYDGNQDGKNNARFFRSKSGHKMIFDDGGGAEPAGVFFRDRSGDTSFELFNPMATARAFATKTIHVQAKGDIVLEAAKDITMTAMNTGITMHAKAGNVVMLANNKAQLASGGPIAAKATAEANLFSPSKISLTADQQVQIKMDTVAFLNGGGNFSVKTSQIFMKYGSTYTMRGGRADMGADAMMVCHSKGGQLKAHGGAGAGIKGGVIGVSGGIVWLCPM